MVFKHRDFRVLWIGQLVSKLGSQFNYIALAWLVLTTTDSAAATSGVYLAQVLPVALLGWLAGVPVDRSNRRHMMIHCDWIRALLVLVLPISFALHAISNWLIYAVTFLVSGLTLLFYAAEKSVIPQIVPEEDLTEANALAEMTEQIGALAGPILAGMLIAVLPSPIYILYLDALSFLFSALTIWWLRYRDERVQIPCSASALYREAREGLVFLWRQPVLRLVILTAAAINFLAAPFTVVFPVLSEKVFHSGSSGFGWLMGAFGGGMLVGSLLAGWLAKRLSSRAIIYGGMVLLGVGFVAMAVSSSIILAVVLAFVAALGVGPGNAVIITMVQTNTPEDMLGRIFASMSGIVQAAIPIGVALAAPSLDAWGAPRTLMLMGGGCVVFAIIGAYCQSALACASEQDASRA